jgi:carbamoylphosphate synthase large subunit
MVNSNPETVSTDFDISDKLFFEPLTLEDVLEIVQREQPVGVIVQLGGQTPLKLTRALEAAGVRILGTSPDAIDIAEDRRRFEKIARELSIEQPANGTATSVDEAVAIADMIGYPVLVRPSYVLGGRAMEIVHDAESLRDYFERAARVSEERPVLVDRFLEDAFEADVDALSDGTDVVIGAVMEHIESAGIHSGDSACVLPPYLIPPEAVDQMRAHTVAFAKALGVVGLINVQYAYKDGVVYVIEVNPRASRTAPFVSKAIGVSLPSVAARLMLGETLAQVGFTHEIIPPYVSVKEAVFPSTFREFDPVLGRDAPTAKSGDRRRFRHGVPRRSPRTMPCRAKGLSSSRSMSPTNRPPWHWPEVPRPRLQAVCHQRHRSLSARARRRGRNRAQSARGPTARRGHDPQRAGAVAGQHAARQTRAGGRRTVAPGRDRQSRAVYHHVVRGERGGGSDCGSSDARANGACAAGVA